MAFIDKDDAREIAKKLKAKWTKKTKAHDVWCVYDGEKLIAHFGIRHGSKHDLGHDHIPGSIFESAHNTK